MNIEITKIPEIEKTKLSRSGTNRSKKEVDMARAEFSRQLGHLEPKSSFGQTQLELRIYYYHTYIIES